MFGIIGALILSREPGNRIGGSCSTGRGSTAASFLAGELMTYLVRRRDDRGRPWWRILGLLSDARLARRHHPGPALPPLAVPGRPPPVPAVGPLAGSVRRLIGFLLVALVFGDAVFAGSSGPPRVENPLYISAIDRVRDPRRRHQHRAPGRARGFGRLARGPLPPLEGRRTPADQVGGARAGSCWCSRSCSRRCSSSSAWTSGLVESILSGIAFLALPVSIGDRRPAVPPVRARRRREEDARRRDARPARDRRLRRRRLAASASLASGRREPRGRCS